MCLSTDKRRVLVVVTELPTPSLVEQLLAGHGGADLVVVAPVLLRRLHFWTTDDRRGRIDAAARLASWLDTLVAAGAEASGYVGIAEPLQVIQDALVLVAGDELVVTPAGRDHWQVRDLARRVRERVSIPVAELPQARGADGLVDAA
jgi:hypothetical protein